MALLSLPCHIHTYNNLPKNWLSNAFMDSISHKAKIRSKKKNNNENNNHNWSKYKNKTKKNKNKTSLCLRLQLLFNSSKKVNLYYTDDGKGFSHALMLYGYVFIVPTFIFCIRWNLHCSFNLIAIICICRTVWKKKETE